MIRSILVSIFLFCCSFHLNAQCTATLSGGGTICEGESIDLQVILTGTAPWELVYLIDGIPFTVSGINFSPHTLTATAGGIYTLQSVSATGCSNGTIGGIANVEILEVPVADNIIEICDPASNSFTVSFEIYGGDPASYFVNPPTGNITGNTFVSDPFPSAFVYLFEISDANACGSDLVTGEHVCDCNSQVGEMVTAPISLCGETEVTGDYDNTNEQLDPDDILLFYLTETNSTNALSTAVATNTTADFTFDPATMSFGNTYYIFAAVGSEDGNGGIDLSDLCISISQGTPVTFFENNMGIICSNALLSCIQPSIVLDCTAFNGTTPYTYEWTSPGGFISNLIAPVVNAPGTYSLVVTDLNGCTVGSDVLVLQDFDVPNCEIEINETLSCINTEIEVTPQCTGGVPPFEFFWSNGSTAATVIISDPGSYSVTISDANGCLTENSFQVLYSDEGCGTIRGYTRNDENLNCVSETTENPLPSWTIRATNGSDDYYGITNADGLYEIAVLPGDYDVEIINNIPGFWNACASIASVSVTDEFDVETVDFPLQKLVDCPAMQVDISIPRLRRCFTNDYHVNYCNHGTTVAEDVYIETTFDLDFTINSAGVPYTSPSPGLYVFDIGDVEIGECGTFSINTTLSCDAELGETICTEAHIFPDTNCIQPDPLWSGASLEITSECDGSEVTFFITNNGTGNMSEPSFFIVIEDGVMLHLDPEEVQLPTGETLEINYPANGSTYILQVDQVSNHPGFSAPIQALEGCGVNSTGGFSTGFVTQFPEDDADPFISIDCQEVVGSFDPNDKYGYPKGYGDEQLIELGQELEYRIRFQNTGTDTAFTVVIEDVLSPHLDITTLRPGAASHPYELDIFGSDTLVFTFNDILLPDSNVNEALSHGFVKFRISQNAANMLGDVIENEAAIYFDFNAPIITNKTVHRLGDEFIMTAIEDLQHALIQHTIQPNPSSGTATLSLFGQIPLGQMTMQIFDVAGRIEHVQTLQTPVSSLHLEQLGSGLYFYEIRTTEGAIGRGKLIVKK
ncbi:MAG: T9SS type A sorting domain-containing protein [Bacteroidota bacterium]